MQDLVADAVATTGKGCYWNQDVPALLMHTGLKVVSRHDALGGLITLLEAQHL